MLRLLVALTEKIPVFRRWIWQRWYQHVIQYGGQDWTLMNYGYVDRNDDAPALDLDEADEPDRCCLQLYHRVAASIELQSLNVLEVGSGRGGGASYVARYLKPASVTGIDYSAKAVAFCNRTHDVQNLKFVQGDAEALPFEDGVFDAVVNVESSHCYGSMSQFLSEVVRVLRPDGHFLFTDFRTHDDIEGLRKLFAESGLTILQEEDITANVVQSMEQDEGRKRALIEQKIPAWLRGTFFEFAGVQDSKVFNSFKDRSMIYLRFVLKKES